jgi:NADH:ubiquinone oxidoreductase subunit E
MQENPTPSKPTNDDLKREISLILQEMKKDRENLIPILHKITQRFGYISSQALYEVSEQTAIPLSEVFSVATFYRMLPTQQRGRHVILFCESLPCHVVGGREVLQALKAELQLEPSETSQDERWTLLTTSCLGVCDYGPVISIDGNIHGNLTPESLPEILNKYK